MHSFWLLIVLLISIRCASSIKRSNNSPASSMLPSGDYYEDVEALYRLDCLIRGLDNGLLRNSLARALLLVCPLAKGESVKLNLRSCVLNKDDMAVLEGLFGVSIAQDPDCSADNNQKKSDDDDDQNRWVFTRMAGPSSKSMEHLLQDVVIGSRQTMATEHEQARRKDLSALALGTSTSTSSSESVAERVLVQQAYDDIALGKKSRSIMTRAQRIWELYRRDFQRFPSIKVRVYDGYLTGGAFVGEVCGVSLLATFSEALALVEEAVPLLRDGKKKLYCLRHGASLVQLDLSSSFMKADLRPPGVNLYLM